MLYEVITDMNAACSGFLYGLDTATKFVLTGHKKVVVVSAEKMSSITDYTDRTTCVLFGDAATAILLEPTEEEIGVMDTILRSNGIGRHHLVMKAGGSVKPASHESVDAKEHTVYQEGQAVFKHAVSNMADVASYNFV